MIGSPAIVAPNLTTAPLTVAPVSTLNFAQRIDPTTGQPQWHATGIQGAGQRFGEWLHQPGMGGALLRGAAASFNGDGLGGAINAGAGYMDQQKATAAHAQQTQFENSMAVLKQAVEQQQANQTGDYQQGTLRNAADKTLVDLNLGQGKLGLDANGQAIQLHGIDTAAETARRGQDVQVQTTGMNNATTTANTTANNAQSDANSQRTYDASIYGHNVQLKTAGIGSKAGAGGYTQTQVTTPATPATNPWFGAATPAVPKTVTTTRAPVAQPVASTPRATGDADYARLASGTVFVGPDGQQRRKP